MKDLTVIYLTVNELPEEWLNYQQKVLLESIGDFPLISISRKPMDFGKNVLQTEPKSLSNIYWQLLRGAKMAETDYIAVAEDDTLYNREHFLFRPEKDTFAYNMSHWSIFTWGEPIYSWRNRRGNYALIAPRELAVEALEERFAKFPNGTPDNITGEMGRGMVERNMKITIRKAFDFHTTLPIINFNHDFASDPLQRRHRKRLGTLRAYDIPYWGKASELVKKYPK